MKKILLFFRANTLHPFGLSPQDRRLDAGMKPKEELAHKGYSALLVQSSSLLIIFLAIFLRFWNISKIPPSLSHDEVAIGYNAYSILTTGKDEYGISWPLLFRSFDDYKLPGYIYTTVISEKIFGVNEFAVRFPSAFLGTLTVVVFYFLIKELLYADIGRRFAFDRAPKFAPFESLSSLKHVSSSSVKSPPNSPLRSDIPIIATAMLAISPWHINFSRAAFETNGSLFFIVLGALFLFKGLRNPRHYIIASMAFGLSIYFYYTARVLVPILAITFFFVYYKKILAVKKWIIIACAIGFILLLPLLPHMFTSGLLRVNQVSIFQDKSLTNPYSEAIIRNNNSFLAKLIYNRRVAYLHLFADNYLKNFSPDFYFVSGTGPMGLLYLWEIPFFLLGLLIVVRLQERWKWIILVWFFSVPIVGGLTTGQPNALRTLANVPMTSFFSALGLYRIIRNKYEIARFAFALIVIFFFVRFLFLYFDYYPRLTASAWGDGHKQMAQFVKENMQSISSNKQSLRSSPSAAGLKQSFSSNKDRYDYIYITGDYWRPYIYLLFYMKYQPSQYQKDGTKSHFENLYFGQASWDRGEGVQLANTNLSLLAKRKTLFILSGNDFQSQKNLIESEKRPYRLRVIKRIDGVLTNSAFYAVMLR